MRKHHRALGALPSPLWGGVGGGGPSADHRTTPTPTLRADPPHKGEGRTEFVARSVAFSPASASPAAPALAHGGGGGGAGLALEGIPFQRNGVGGLARRERLGREIVDRRRGGGGGGGGAQLVRLGVGDQPLLPRRLDVADVRRVQAIAQRLRRNHARERALEAREPLVAGAVEDVD